MSLLTVQGLSVRFKTRRGHIPAVAGVDFTLDRGEALGIIGESGSGKSQILLALMGLLADNAARAGTIEFTGNHMAMVFQDPLTALNPYLRVGVQVAEALRGRGDTRAARARVIEMFRRLRIADPEARVDQYPHQLSGGMRQRVLIAMALIGSPDLILADEPTTALDVTVQADILDLLKTARRDHGRALIIVTHDLGVVAGLCDRVLVMYAGRIVEEAPIGELFSQPRHPYTMALLAASPRLDDAIESDLVTIPGSPPDLTQRVPGCAFAPRCAEKFEICETVAPVLQATGAGRRAACHRLDG